MSVGRPAPGVSERHGAGSAVHALTPEGRRRIEAFAARAPLAVFDVDGTLAPIVARPEDAAIPPALVAALTRLAAVAPVGILTGRAAADAWRMVGFTPRWVLGNHGIEGLPGYEARAEALTRTCAAWHAALARDAALRDASVALEDKRYSLSLHFRGAPDQAAAQAAIDRAVAALLPPARRIEGKCVVNLLPADAIDKGQALAALLDLTGTAGALYAGDDTTDEHVFDLPGERVLGVRVGRDVRSRAALYVEHAGEMLPVVEMITHAWPPGRG
jgi:trehalose 6-phosphate phosphatase